MAFDIEGARKAGYSDTEIAQHLAASTKFDIDGARKAGYSDAELVTHLATAAPSKPATATPDDGRLSRLTSPEGVEMMKREATAFLSPVRGIKDVIDTGAEWLARGLSGKAEGDRVKARNDADKRKFAEDTQGSLVAPLGRVAGNVVATAPVGGLLGAGAQAANLPRLASALRSGGFATGAAPVGVAAKTADMGIRMAGGGLTGGASAALVDPESALLGGTVGAALPPIAKGMGLLGGGLSALTPKGGERVAVDRIANTIGNGSLRQAVGDIQTYYPKGAENIPVSAAGITQSPSLARLEQGSRLRSSPQWTEFDQRQSKAVADNVLKATDEADELGARFSDRAQNWADNWALASTKIKPRVFAKRMGALYDDLQQAKASPDAVNGDVAAVLDEIEGTVMKFGSGFTPGHLQKLRAEFNGKVKPMAKTAMQSAPRDNPAIRSLIAEMDDILNATTSGKWDKVRAGYAEDSAKVHASKAAQVVRDAFIDPSTGIVRKAADAAGDVPRVTDAGLMRAIEAARMPDKTLALSAEAAQRLEATLGALRRQGILQNVKRSASAGGGSDTMGNSVALDVMERGLVPPGIGGSLLSGLLSGARGLATGRIDDATARLLMNPDDLALALDALTRRPPARPLVPYQAVPVIGADRQ